MEIKFRPIKGRILGKQVKHKVVNKTASGIITNAQEEQELPTNQLDVIKVGKDVQEVKENDKVIFDGRGTRISFSGEEYLILESENNVFGVLED